MVQLFATSGHPDQMPQNVASDLGLHCLPVTPLGFSSLQWIKMAKFSSRATNEYIRKTIFI